MRILEYGYSDNIDVNAGGWRFNNIEFKKVNLLVGDTGTGKSRFIYSLFNLGRSLVQKELDKMGNWTVKFSINDKNYLLKFTTVQNEDSVFVIKNEEIIETIKNIERVIIKRDKDKFIYLDKELPKLSLNSSGVALLKEENIIKEIHEGFSTMLKRIFAIDSPQKNLNYNVLSLTMFKEIEKDPNLERLFHSELNLNIKLYVVQKFFPKEFNEIKKQYKNVFPFIEDIKVIESIVSEYDVPGLMPAFAIKEKNVSSWIRLPELSSGMQKVLMILSDLILFPKSGIYLIDEYENSLGISAINFFPDYILNIEKDIQFIITSHHPYIINKIPIDNWYLFHREGSIVTIKYGKEIKERFSKSKQEAFIQLINDSYYNKGVE